MLERLLESCEIHGRSLASASTAVRAFDLLDVNAELARKSVVAQLRARRRPRRWSRARRPA